MDDKQPGEKIFQIRIPKYKDLMLIEFWIFSAQNVYG